MDKGLLLLILASCWAFCSKTSLAQQDGPVTERPETPSSPPTSGTAGDQSTLSGPASSPQGVAEAPPMPALSGVEKLSPGPSGASESYLLPSFEWTGYGDTNPSGSGRQSGISLESIYVGSLTLQRVKRRSKLNLDYAGGAFFFNRRIDNGLKPHTAANGTFHKLDIFESVSLRRWKLLLGDSAFYLPEIPLGFAGFGGLTSFGSGLGGGFLANTPSLNPQFVPNQTIFTGRARQVSNVAVTQVQYNPTPRSAITGAGAYGTLQFLEPGFIDGRYWYGTGGYTHVLGRHDEIGLMYLHAFFNFNAGNQEFLERGLQLSYGHRLAGRLSLEISGGPVAFQIAQPLGGALTRSFWSTYDSLEYRARRGNFSLSFLRSTTGGSGVLPGAETDWAQLGGGRQLSRKWFGSINVAHAYNQSLTRVTTTQRRSKYEYWQAGATLSRALGERLSFYVNYYAQRQLSNNPVCYGSRCTTLLLRQVGGIGINWHGRPVRIE